MATRKRKKKSKGLVGTFALIVVLAVLTVGGYFGYREYYDRKVSNIEWSAKNSEIKAENGGAAVYVYPNNTAEEVLASIENSPLIKVKSKESLRRQFEKNNLSGQMRKPGRYVIKPGMSSSQIARLFSTGSQTPCKLVLSGSLRLRDQIAGKIGAQMMVDSAEVRSKMNDAAFLKEFGVTPETVFALFVPDTYEVWWNASIHDIFAKFKEAGDRFWTEERLCKAKKQGLTKMEVITLASIVKGETNYEPEYPKIASVYLNRLKRRMKLQACPTVCYLYDYKINRVLNTHLKTESPYNTYIHEGLPPAPIAVPDKACIDAVLNPAQESYLYFCARDTFDGQHYFATTYSEHLKNAKAYQRAFDNRQKNKK